MDLKRLFHVLVVGGSVAAGCEQSRTSGLGAGDGAGPPDRGMPDAGAPEVSMAPEDAAADAAAAEDAPTDASVTMDAAATSDAAVGPMGNPCFCSPTKCCDVHEGAPATVQPGLYCCWGTKC
jgi:hypothetical protein